MNCQKGGSWKTLGADRNVNIRAFYDNIKISKKRKIEENVCQNVFAISLRIDWYGNSDPGGEENGWI